MNKKASLLQRSISLISTEPPNFLLTSIYRLTSHSSTFKVAAISELPPNVFGGVGRIPGAETASPGIELQPVMLFQQ